MDEGSAARTLGAGSNFSFTQLWEEGEKEVANFSMVGALELLVAEDLVVPMEDVSKIST